MIKILDFCKAYYQRNKRNLLTGIALSGCVTNAFMWFDAGSKCNEIFKEKNDDLKYCDDKEGERAVMFETIKEVTPVVLPPLVMTIGTGAAILYSNKEAAKEIAVLSTAYAVTKKDLVDTRLKMKDIFGEKKSRNVMDQVTKDRFEQTQNAYPNVYDTHRGKVLCKDEYSGRFFYSNATEIQLAINKLSIKLPHEMWIELNYFYELLGLEQIKMGDQLGWNAEDTYNGEIPIRFTSLLTDHDEPCLVISFDISPKERKRDW